MKNVLIICSPSTSNAYLCSSLKSLYPTIIHFKLPKINSFRNKLNKIIRKGFLQSIGIWLTSRLIIFERIIERLTGEFLWEKLYEHQPTWKELVNQIHICYSETEVYPFLKDADCIVLLESFRFSEKFYRNCKRPVLQVIDGVAPNYMGNAGAFWAYATCDFNNIGKSVIARRANFSKFEIIETIKVKPTRRETIRSLQIKCSIALAEILSELIEAYPHKKIDSISFKNCIILSSPNILDYLTSIYRKGSLKRIPNYAKQ